MGIKKDRQGKHLVHKVTPTKWRGSDSGINDAAAVVSGADYCQSLKTAGIFFLLVPE